MNSISVNWQEGFEDDKWEFIGASLMEQKSRDKLESCPHGGEANGFCDDCDAYPNDVRSDNMPMMNFAYPLHAYRGVSDEKIIEVCERTNCTVVYNNEEDAYYLALCGGGMNLSQDIALAYIIADGCIDWDMLEDVYISGMLSVSEEDYKTILKELKRQLAIKRDNLDRRLKEVKEKLKECLN